MHTRALLPVLLLAACGGKTPPPPAGSAPAAAAAPPAVSASAASAEPNAPAAAPSPEAPIVTKPFALPGATAPVSLDYLAIDRPRGRVFIPVGDTGSHDVFDIATGAFTRVDGFKTAERELRGKKRLTGPSAVAVGDGVVYVGNRATSEVCAVDTKALKLGKCIKLPTPTDGVAYVPSSKEVWVTTPRDQSITVLDASKPDALKQKLVIKLGGATEGYAFDDTRDLFFTNLEDKDKTIAVDVKTHAAKGTWNAGCGGDGPRGVAVDAARNLVIVACTDHLQVLDGAHGGAPLGKLDTGAGVDNIDYVSDRHLVFAVAGKAAKLTVARLDDKGQLSVAATAATREGTRNVVADAAGNAYVADAQGARLIVASAGAREK